MQLNYDWAELHVSTEPGLNAVMSRIRPFFIRGTLWMSPSSISGMRPGLFRDVNTEDVSSIFILCSPRRGGSLAFCPARLASAGLITNRTSVERLFNVTAFLVCLSYSLRRLNISLCQLHLEIVCCLSLKERLSHPAGVLVKVTLKFAHESPRRSVYPAAGTNIILCIYSTSHNKAGLTKQCTFLLIEFI